MVNRPVPKVMSWPLEGVDENGRLQYARDDDSIREVIRNILLTRPGERLLRPRFGAGLPDFIHQPNNATTRTVIANVVRKAIEQWETRVLVESVEVLPDDGRLSTVHIIIRYRMCHAPQARQLTFALDLGSV